MSEEQSGPPPPVESGGIPPLLNLAVPAIMLCVTVAYAWSLRGIVNAQMNLLLLKPVLFVFWVLLGVIIVKDVVPSIRLQMAGRPAAPARSRTVWLEPRSEAAAGFVVLATLGFAFTGPGHGPIVYLASLFAYLGVAGYLIGDRKLPKLILVAALCSVGLYVVMGLLLGVRL